MKRTIGLFLLVPISLCSCADHAALNAAKGQATATYHSCLRANAARLDDGRNDTLTVAYAVKAACLEQFRSAKKAYAEASDMTPGYRDLFLADSNEAEQVEAAMTAVSINRTSTAHAR